jgi:hypothetical protein
MAKIMEYISQPAGRDRIIRNIGLFNVIGAAIVTIILLVATVLR